MVDPISKPLADADLLDSRSAGRPVRRTDCTLATVDHNVPCVYVSRILIFAVPTPLLSTVSRKNFISVTDFIAEPDSRAQCVALEENVKEFGLTYFGMKDRRQGTHKPFAIR